MPYDKPLIAHKLQRWDQYITDYHLPQWDSIPAPARALLLGSTSP